METINNLNSLNAFVLVAKHSSFSKAAQELNVSKAYLSKTVQSLEYELAHKLFHRTTRQVKLTREGEKFFEQCDEAIQKIKQAKSDLMQTQQSPKGMLRVTMAGAFGEKYITPLALELMNRYPDLQIELSFSERIVDLNKEDFDLAIRVGTLNDSKVKATKIAVRKEYICATREYLEKNGVPKKPEDLRSHQCLIASNEQWIFQDAKKQKSLKVSGKLKSNNGRVILMATLQGQGISKLPGVYVKEWIENGKLIPLLQEYLPHEVPIWAITPLSKKETLSTKYFLKELEKLSQGYF